MRDYERRKDTLTKKEQDTVKDMKIVQEMYARGFDFCPIDLSLVKARHFQILDGKLMPALLDYVCAHMKEKGIHTLYLITDLDSFYERYGWEFLCMVQGNGETGMTRMYIHRG